VPAAKQPGSRPVDFRTAGYVQLVTAERHHTNGNAAGQFVLRGSRAAAGNGHRRAFQDGVVRGESEHRGIGRDVQAGRKGRAEIA